jgi:uncharacterized protein with ParB-like and HNH nuclease domain
MMRARIDNLHAECELLPSKIACGDSKFPKGPRAEERGGMSETIFTKVDYALGALMNAIELGMIGLPEIQRPFVWKNPKIRNLFDSMYQGFPVGYLLFWENGAAEDSRAIGVDGKQKVPQQLIVDGQQRLTSLYAVIKGVPVVRENYDAERIEIAFNPLAGKFEVADAAIKRDKSFIPNISTVWAKGADLFEIVDTYMEGLASTREISAEERKLIRRAFTKLQNLLSFPFTALSLRANIDEEQVAEVFVRINSEGKTLNQADFILTLMSVFWDEGRAQLEAFCGNARKPAAGQASPFNYTFRPDPDHLLRVSINVAFRRARLKVSLLGAARKGPRDRAIQSGTAGCAVRTSEVGAGQGAEPSILARLL